MTTAPHIIVLPGGGYAGHAPREAEPVVRMFERWGATAGVLRYPVATRHPGPVDAVLAHVRELRAAGCDRVGIIGFSAGGHLAGHAALAGGGAAERLDAVILGYPVVSMELPTHAGSRENLLGAQATGAHRAATSLDRLVTPAAPPFFVWHTADDEAVPVEHSYLLGSALAANGVDHELHVFAHGRHGLGLAEGAGEPGTWTTLCARWLEGLDWLPAGSAQRAEDATER